MSNEEYKIDIKFGALKMLGPSLYTNIYYVLAELIANAYDADAENVYIMQNEDSIIIEDDGRGMSREELREIYLIVGKETRTSKDDERTEKGRAKMGRKGIGKLSALAVSDDVDVMTIKNGKKSGFELSSSTNSENKDPTILPSIPENKIIFNKITEHGTSIIMKNKLNYKISSNLKDIVKPNLLRMFKVPDKNFRIHIQVANKDIVIDNMDEEIISDAATLITLGEEFHHLGNLVNTFSKQDKLKIKGKYKDKLSKLVEKLEEIDIPIKLTNKLGEEKTYSLKIKGWIGSLKVANKKTSSPLTDFQPNFISLFSNGKLGEYNIIPKVSTNRLSDSYLIGQLHVDLFEDSELEDMALSNRQGYKTEDPRYEEVANRIRTDLLKKVLSKISIFSELKKVIKGKNTNDVIYKKEQTLITKVKMLEKLIKNDIKKAVNIAHQSKQELDYIISSKSWDALIKIVGIKFAVDNSKKKILISHTEKDKEIADLLYEMLLHNNVTADEIIYTNSDDMKAWIPDDEEVYGYLKSHFVSSFSIQKIYVLFIDSKNLEKSWNAIIEVGAAWVTEQEHSIFNISDGDDKHRPQAPLNIEKQWINIRRKDGKILLSKIHAKKLCRRIDVICDTISYDYEKKGVEANLKFLRSKKNIIIQD